LAGLAGFQLIENPTGSQMDQLIAEAHLHILPAFQSTGVKLKLVKSLFQGRFVLTNPQMVEGTGLDDVCISFRKPADLIQLIKELRNKPFTQTEIDRRKNLLAGFNDHLGAAVIQKVMFPD
jgi:hypothetical protein